MKKLIVNAATSMLLLFGTIQNYSCTKEAATAPNHPAATASPQTQIVPKIIVYIDSI